MYAPEHLNNQCESKILWHFLEFAIQQKRLIVQLLLQIFSPMGTISSGALE
jgi:hypothetical protein